MQVPVLRAHRSTAPERRSTAVVALRHGAAGGESTGALSDSSLRWTPTRELLESDEISLCPAGRQRLATGHRMIDAAAGLPSPAAVNYTERPFLLAPCDGVG